MAAAEGSVRRLGALLGSFLLLLAPAAGAPLKIALVLPGRVNEPGYFNAGFQALLETKARFGAEITYQESLKPADAEVVLRSLAEDGYRYVIVMGGGNYDDQIGDIAADYPAMRFIVVSGAFTRLPNIVAVRTGHPGVPYLAGVLMASLSQTGRIALIGGRASPPAMADHVAVIAGARHVNAAVQVDDVYTETYDDPALGKEATLAAIDRGADIIFTNANTTSFGVFQAARERHLLVVGSATDQNPVAPDTIVTSAVYGMDTAVAGLIALDLGHQPWEGRIYTVGLPQVDLAPFHGLEDRVSPAVRARLARTRADLLAGRLVIPGSYAALAAPAKP